MDKYNLEQHNSQNTSHNQTLATGVHYAIAKAIKDRLEVAPKLPGTYWKIVPHPDNKPVTAN